MSAPRPPVDLDALVAATVAIGFSEGVARRGLEAELEAWSDEAIARALAAELAPVPAWRAHAPRVALVIAARTLPASAIRQVLAARVLGARVLLKSASGQEALGEAIARLDPGIVPTPFASSDVAALDRALAESDVVVVLGSDETVAAVRARVPGDHGFVGHGHRASAAWLADDAPDADVTGLAEDLCAWDQAGCLAPHVAWVDGDPARLGERLARALEVIERDPARAPTPHDAHARHLHRQAATLAIMAGGRAWRSAQATLATHPDPAFRVSPGARLLWLLPADAGALAAFEPRLSSLALGAGLAPPIALGPHVRLCRPGQLQRPPLDWHQDGLPLFASLLVKGVGSAPPISA
ncbi:MAG: hypothetical protein IT385_14380 [Deltaproteobacteria bacterium]|nr:hypothetical protein [Deltaproteobacteria bacterium]